MSKQDAARSAMVGQLFRPKPQTEASQTPVETFETANVVNLAPEAEMPPSGPENATGAGKTVRAGKVPAGRKGTVAATASRVSLYLPPKAKRKIEEIAFHDRRKEHDIFVEAIREYLERNGHKGLI